MRGVLTPRASSFTWLTHFDCDLHLCLLSLLLCITLNGGGTTRQAEAFTQRANQNILKTAELRQHRWQKLRNQAQSVKQTPRTRLSSAVIEVVHTQVTPVNDVATSRSTSPSWRVRRSHLTAVCTRHRRLPPVLCCPVLSYGCATPGR
eukprot:COSAG01_NODE_395_length_17610_cov_20.238764_5_plen_148_part_00